MGDPFMTVQGAVSRYAANARGAGTTGSGNMGEAAGAAALDGPAPAFLANEPAVATWDPTIGRLVARYPIVGYPRTLDHLAVMASVSGPVHVYVGAIADSARYTSYGDGRLADYDPNHPPYVPAGAAVYIVWDTANPAATGSAVAQFRQVTA